MRSDIVKYWGVFTAAISIGLTTTVYLNYSVKSEYFAIAGGVLAIIASAYSAFFMWRELVKERAVKSVGRVFIAYARKDIHAAQNITKILRSHGFKPWLDVDEIEAGQIWKEAIDNAIDESAIALVIVSENLSKSASAMEELRYASSRLRSGDRFSTPIIPVKIDHADIPASIAQIQYVDMENPDAEEFLIKSLEGAMRRMTGISRLDDPQANSALKTNEKT